MILVYISENIYTSTAKMLKADVKRITPTSPHPT
jgi:hypothetical protein